MADDRYPYAMYEWSCYRLFLTPHPFDDGVLNITLEDKQLRKDVSFCLLDDNLQSFAQKVAGFAKAYQSPAIPPIRSEEI